MYYVYVIFSIEHKRSYTGMTSDIPKRIGQHNRKENKSTKAYAPWELIYQEEFKTRIEARKREKHLKSGSGREFIKTLLNSQSKWLRGATE